MEGQIDDLIGEINTRTQRNERVLITTLTKKMAEDLTAYLQNTGIKVRYMHHDIDTIERMEIMRDLRLGTFDVLVGINLLRRAWTCPRCPWWPFWTRTRRASSAARPPSSRPSAGGAAPKRRRHGHPVRRHHHPLHAPGHGRDRAPPGEKQDAYNKAHGITPRRWSSRCGSCWRISATAEDVASDQRQGRVKAMTKQEKAAEIRPSGEGYERGGKNVGVRAGGFPAGSDYRVEREVRRILWILSQNENRIV